MVSLLHAGVQQECLGDWIMAAKRPPECAHWLTHVSILSFTPVLAEHPLLARCYPYCKTAQVFRLESPSGFTEPHLSPRQVAGHSRQRAD
jgi:hypothetical protein